MELICHDVVVNDIVYQGCSIGDCDRTNNFIDESAGREQNSFGNAFKFIGIGQTIPLAFGVILRFLGHFVQQFR